MILLSRGLVLTVNGNRTAAEGRDYTANNLNQYTAIDTFAPTYDLDGNQTSVLTETGVADL